MLTILLYPLIIFGGVLQAMGAPMNARLREALINPWLATLISFMVVVALFVVVAACLPRPLPSVQNVTGMPWWAPLGGVAGACAVVAGLLFVDKIGAGPYAALTIGANLIASIALDQFGLLGLPLHEVSLWRAIGAALMLIGIGLIALF